MSGVSRKNSLPRFRRLSVVLLMSCATSFAQEAAQTPKEMEDRISRLESEVAELKAMVRSLQPVSPTSSVSSASPVPEVRPEPPSPPASSISGPAPVDTQEGRIRSFLKATTLDVGLDGYYAYNFNQPVGRVNLLRAYDVLSNEFSLNQANIVVDHPADASAGRRWGGRLDLQFGQATDTLQGNPTNEPRPDIYRNIFQAYGTYIVPLGSGLTIDFGKWSSSLGIEGNYSKDQWNYSRSYWFDFLPFYHMGIRATYPVTGKFSLNYWIVNGTNQVEATNGFKDELFGFTAKPSSHIVWTLNYYLGQDHPDRTVSDTASPIPVQPGLNFVAIRPAPDGRTHIFDSYVTWAPNSKLTFALEGDYLIQRLWRTQALGESAAPQHAIGGAAYLRYQLASRMALGTRAEYLSDRGGLFSGITQALKENTVTFDYKLTDGFLMRYEWRRDFSNEPTFLTDQQGVLAKTQSTATLGLMWWWGGKEGAW